MALLFADGFDHYAVTQWLTKWTAGAPIGFAGPGRLGYGQYVRCAGSNVQSGGYRAIAASTTVIAGGAVFVPQTAPTNNLFFFLDGNGSTLANITVSPTGAVIYNVGATQTVISANGIAPAQAWFYLEAQVTFSASATGSVTLRVNGSTVASVGTVITAATSNPCSAVGLGNLSNGECDYDDFYVLSTTAPNNTFLGDVKIVPLYPAGNGRVSGFSRFGGTSAGNYTAVNEVPPDGDTSYVYSAVAGTVDAYTLTALSNVATIKAVQLDGYVRKDDTPSRTVSLGVGNGTTENFDAGTSVNTTYTYILRQLDTNPLTSAAWAVTDFSTLQSAVKLVS